MRIKGQGVVLTIDQHCNCSEQKLPYEVRVSDRDTIGQRDELASQLDGVVHKRGALHLLRRTFQGVERIGHKGWTLGRM